MHESWDEKLIGKCRRAIFRHPFCKLPIMFYFVIAMILYKVFFLFFSNKKKLATIIVSMVFFIFSCSFCTPVINLAEAAMLDTEETESISILNGETFTDNSSDPNSDILTEETMSEENEEYVEDENKYSIDEILENSQYTDEISDEYSESGADTVSSNDSDSSEPVFHKDDWNLILINKQHPIPDDYNFNLGVITGNLQCDERVIPELLAMLKQAKADNISLLICSPYRSKEYQTQLFDRKIDAYMEQGLSYMDAYKLTSQAVTIPGSSEHQAGLAIDIYTDSYTTLDAGFGNTDAGKWLAAHCSEYGFILRYPEGKEYITGIEYEPWHFRYVGKDAAQIIMEQGITLEEFIDSL